MAVGKTERLLNLTMALLATRKYLTKSEIFATVSGYEGGLESMERMFERDKDDLRSIGIEIEVGSLSAYFEDEQGYRIRPDIYGLDVGPITPRELALLSLAATSWRTASLSESAASGLRKLRSLGIPLADEEIAIGLTSVDSPQQYFDVIWDAIDTRRLIEFSYPDSQGLLVHRRRVQAYSLLLWRGSWYLIGLDLNRAAIRTFKLIRIVGEVDLSGPVGAYEIPEGFSAHDYLSSIPNEQLREARILIRKERCLGLRSRGIVVSHDEDWDLLTLSFHHNAQFVKEVLWYGSDAQIIEPADLIQLISEQLQGLVT